MAEHKTREVCGLVRHMGLLKTQFERWLQTAMQWSHPSVMDGCSLGCVSVSRAGDTQGHLTGSLILLLNTTPYLGWLLRGQADTGLWLMTCIARPRASCPVRGQPADFRTAQGVLFPCKMNSAWRCIDPIWSLLTHPDRSSTKLLTEQTI